MKLEIELDDQWYAVAKRIYGNVDIAKLISLQFCSGLAMFVTNPDLLISVANGTLSPVEFSEKVKSVGGNILRKLKDADDTATP